MVMKSVTFTQLWDRLQELGLSDDEIQNYVRTAQERAPKMDSVYIWKKDPQAKTTVIQCQKVEESGEEHEEWFMQG